MPRGRHVAQDDARENRLVDLFNLVRPPDRVRHGTDALLLVDGHELEFELKSVTRIDGSVSTVRDLGPDHIQKWRNKHWLVAFYDEVELLDCRYGSPDDMAPWISTIWEYVSADFAMAQLVPGLITMDVMTRIVGQKERYTLDDAKKLQKKQFKAAQYRAMMDMEEGYSPARMLDIFQERAKYLIERGSTLNNPHIRPEFFQGWKSITADHADALRGHVRAWLASQPPQQLVQLDTP